MYKDGGYIYVYLIYGMYNLLNIVTRTEKEPEAVLIRAVEPIDNLDKFANNRFNRNYEDLSNYQKKNLTNGPGKLTMEKFYLKIICILKILKFQRKLLWIKE